MKKILCFGELLLRLAPDISGSWLEENLMDVFYGGAEFNVVNALAKWEVPVAYSTVIPKNFVTDQLLNLMHSNNIDTTKIFFKDGRMGLYILPKGAEIQHAEIIYDRAYSSFSQIKKGIIDWDEILNDVRWFHFSAICPAVSQGVADVCEEALQVCAKKNIFVSIDLNHRPKLWQYGKRPDEIMPSLVQHCNLIMGNIWSAETMLNINVDEELKRETTKEKYLQQALITSKKIIDQYKNCKAVANTFRFHNSDLVYYGCYYNQQGLFVSKEYHTEKVIDKVGSGDCFMAGLIYGNYNNLGEQEIIEFATAAGFQKLFIKGDCTTKNVDEVKASMNHE